MKTDLYNQQGEKTNEIELPDRIFSSKINPDLLHRAVRVQSANRRVVLAHTKDRSEVRGGGKKPWRQKGTGRARHGSIRSPLWKGGGVTFGPTKNRNFSIKINTKERQKALFAALTGKQRDQQLFVLESFSLPEAKTKVLAAWLKNFWEKVGQTGKNKSLLFILPKTDAVLKRAIQNLPRMNYLAAGSLNVEDILAHKFVLLTKDAVKVIEENYRA